MKEQPMITRRAVLATVAGMSGALAAMNLHAQESPQAAPAPEGRLKQSVSRWCFRMKLEELAQAAKDIGLVSIDLLSLREVEKIKEFGLTCAMPNGPGRIEKGWNDPANHDELVAKSEELLPQIAEAGLNTMIVFSGNRGGMPDSEGLQNCVKGLNRILPLAEQLGVKLVMELLNSKRDHKDYMCDHTAWGAALAAELGPKRFGLLYDIYHMQIMEGDVIATIQENIEYIAHFHTGGVPGRNEIDETQELNYRRIMQAIADTGFTGYVGHEFVPAGPDPIASLRRAFEICSV
ncbi:MAG TPA: TIM barrel protein [Candidatus Hydrogenedentes bacterium]|nr:TIM barrel protein [Candidatus Hydrogenedentota bacterium]HNT87898.1 TIM barrel protein [Candidatus Hydrogenedentota bacterium]